MYGLFCKAEISCTSLGHGRNGIDGKTAGPRLVSHPPQIHPKRAGFRAGQFTDKHRIGNRLLDGERKGLAAVVFILDFNNGQPAAVSMAEAAEYLDDQKTTLRQKWGYGGQYNTFDAFAKEFMAVCEAI